MVLLGVDTGGTFTDFVLFDTDSAATKLRVHKVLSTPKAPERAILQGIEELGLSECEGLLLVHGSTVATNAVLEGKGVRTAFITNIGLRDLLTIGRQARRELYHLNPAPVVPPVPRELCLETGGRLGADGSVVDDLTAADLQTLCASLEALAPEAVAINLLFSYLDDRFERRIAEIVPEGMFVSRSSHILPEAREYERGITTWLNASVGPLVQGYLRRLCAGVPRARIAVMQSAGGTIGAEQAGDEAVHMLLSGPAGGLAGAQYVGSLAGCHRLLSFDMGGTSTDVALLDSGEENDAGKNTRKGAGKNAGKDAKQNEKASADSLLTDLPLTTEGRIGPYPVGVPMVDMHTIGAGGGSIARVDAGGLLQVGPESAGADPGPACYGKGGKEPTVTDANLVLGRLRSEAFLGGGMALDESAAREAVARVALPLGLSVEAAAQGIIDIANEHMARALRVMSVQRGVDPRALTLVSFGGAGGLHVCALAEALDMQQALVPTHAGVLSALGMLVAPRARFHSRTVNQLLPETEDEALLSPLQGEFEMLAQRGRSALLEEGVAAEAIEVRESVDCRYLGQSFSINLPWRGMAETVAMFHARHAKLYGHQLPQPVELVTLRTKVQGAPPMLELPAIGQNTRKDDEAPPVCQSTAKAGLPVYAREELTGTIIGPALITETVSTTYLAPGWECVPDAHGSLLLSRLETGQAPG
jgi:N-methylhydantoinase A